MDVVLITAYFVISSVHSEMQAYCTDHFSMGDYNNNYRRVLPNAHKLNGGSMDQRLIIYVPQGFAVNSAQKN